MKTPAILLLNDGTIFQGYAIGKNDDGYSIGELVFTTGMTGYQETTTDPSYSGQIVTFTYPHIGNYGANDKDLESQKPHVAGIVVREMTSRPSNQRSTTSFPDFLEKHGIIGIEEIDTRALTRHLRENGVMLGVIVHNATVSDKDKWLEVLNNSTDYSGIDFIAQKTVTEPLSVSFKDPNEHDPAGFGPLELVFEPYKDAYTKQKGDDDYLPHIVVIDYGVKWSILRSLLERHVRVTLVPYTTPREQIDAMKPDGILISNGPGDPRNLVQESNDMRKLAEDYPTFGICLGHQLLAQGFGGTTFKLQYGHRGPNQPCLEADTGCVVITSQNHGYAVSRDTFPQDLVETSKNLNDSTISGLKHTSKPISSVQYHPEAGPGPNDAKIEFDRFVDLVNKSIAS